MGDEELAGIFSQYIEHLAVYIENDARHTKPGVFELLSALADPGQCMTGLLTGNIERGARIKLGVFGRNPFFAAGAFGDDHEDRGRLLPVAVERFECLSKESIRYTDCTVIGDTPEDVRCAKIFGARAVAVSTGRYSSAELSAAGSDLVFNDLTEAAEMLLNL